MDSKSGLLDQIAAVRRREADEGGGPEVSTTEAMIAEQGRLAAAVIRHDSVGEVRHVVGVDVAYAADDSHMVCAAAMLDATTLDIVEIATATGVPAIAYTPGLFSFRELPIVREAIDRLSVRPDLVVCDGQGIAHPRRFGLASHLGVVCDLPTIGCAKNRLVGRHDTPADARGSIAPLIDPGEDGRDEVIGAAVRTQTGVKPVYVSIGHRVSLDTACAWVLRLSPTYRLTETVRAADHAVRLALADSRPGSR